MTFSQYVGGLSYLPIGEDQVTPTSSYGQQIGIYYPDGSPRDYWGRGAFRWPGFYAYVVCSAFTSSSDAYSKASGANDITASNIGEAYRALSKGVPVAVIQVSIPNTAAYTGKAFFHAPGGVNRYWEGGFDGTTYTPYHNPFKDVVHAIQWLRWSADIGALTDGNGVGVDQGIVVGGRSAGGMIASQVALSPNRAGELGISAQGAYSTVPNGAVYVSAGYWTVDWILSTNTAVSKIFPQAEVNGGGSEQETQATSLAGAPARYVQEVASWNKLAATHGPVIPPTFYWGSDDFVVRTGGATEYAQLREPFQTNFLDLQVAGDGVHPSNWGYVLKAYFPDRVTLYGTATDHALPTLSKLSKGGYDDGGTVFNDNMAEEAGDLIATWIRQPTWDENPAANGVHQINRRGTVEDYGRYCVPHHPRRTGVIVRNTGANDAIGPSSSEDLLVCSSPNAVIETVAVDGSTYVRGNSPLWLKAETSQANYSISEVFERESRT